MHYASIIPVQTQETSQSGIMQQKPLNNHEFFMRLALEQAQKAYDLGEVPIGAVLVETATGAVAAAAYNQTIRNSDPTAHAEVLVIRDVCARVGAQRIPEYMLYVTLEPCPMCAAALSFARLSHVYFGAHDTKSGGLVSGPNLSASPAIHHKAIVTGGILEEECGTLLKKFFQERR